MHSKKEKKTKSPRQTSEGLNDCTLLSSVHDSEDTEETGSRMLRSHILVVKGKF